MYDDICACSELRDRCFKKAEQARDLHFSAFIVISHAHTHTPSNNPVCFIQNQVVMNLHDRAHQKHLVFLRDKKVQIMY